MTKKKMGIMIIGSMIITIIYFCYNITLGYDSSQYIWLSEMLAGNLDFSNWAPVRSFIFPLGIHIANVLFGKNRYGLLLATFIFYQIMLISVYLMYEEIVEKHDSNKWMRALIVSAIVVLIALNPIIFGFYHVILTEFASITIAILSSFLSWKWISMNFKDESIKFSKVKYSFMTFIFMILTVCSWHLKQPYILTTFVPIVISAIISWIENWNWKNFCQRIVVIILCMISLIISMKWWNYHLKLGNVKLEDDTTSGGILGHSIMEGISAYREDRNPAIYDKENILVDNRITKSDKEKILEILDGKSKQYKCFILLDKGTFMNPIGNRKVIFLKEKQITVGEGIGFVISELKENPETVLGSYISNYLAIIDIYKVRVNVDYGNYYYIEKDFELNFDLEINFLGYNIYRSMTNALDLPEFYSIYAQEYISNNQYIDPVNNYMIKLMTPAKLLFKGIMLCLPVLWILRIICYFIVRKRKKYQKEYLLANHLIFILYSYALAQMTMYSILGALMDRYAMAAYTATLVGVIFDVYVNIFRRKTYKISGEIAENAESINQNKLEKDSKK